MKLKVGQVRYWACVSSDTMRVEYSEWVLRSIQTRGGIKRGYWINKVKGVTWGKRSKKNGDFGFLKNIPAWLRVSMQVSEGAPYSATKKGALAKCIAEIRSDIKRYGADADIWDEGVTVADELAVALRAQKRLK